MANIYIGQLKDLLRNFYNRTQSKRKEIEANNTRYSPEYAQTANTEIMEKMAIDYENVLNSINGIFVNVRGLLAKANFPNVEQLTADRLLFDKTSSFNLSVEDVQGFAERYRDNFTFSRLISDWIGARHKSTKSGEMSPYDAIQINTPADHLSVYQKFCNSAGSIAERIYNGDASKTELDLFADEDFGRDLYAVIGDGRSLDNYKTARVPESATHCFDDVNLRF